MGKQGRNLKNSQITRNHIRFCAQSGRIHGTGVPLKGALKCVENDVEIAFMQREMQINNLILNETEILTLVTPGVIF